MGLFHTHKWVEKERFYALPVAKFSAEKCTMTTAEKVILGVTTILYECDCRKIKTVEILGKSPKGQDES